MRQGRAARRGLALASAQGIVERYAIGICGQAWDVDAGVAELTAAAGGDLDVLAEVAAILTVHYVDRHWLPRAVELLAAAGVTREATDRHAETIRERRAYRAGGFTLAAFADRMNATHPPRSR